MTVNELITKLDLEVLSLEDGEREITGGYTGDLLSWVMGRAESGDMWVTIMTNINVIAVAALADTACVVIAENAEISDDVVAKAKAQGINLLRTPMSAYKVCNEQILL
ncbi:MAG: AraC family transcriptional regulator [Ruminococcaceae bacterium]|nr:AraC family transcriptional regulator [Oscillospiraceae bacterium]